MNQEAKLYSRENSTIVVATVAASASLLILSFSLQQFNHSWDRLGLLFSLLVPGYREITIFTVDYFEYTKELKKRIWFR